MKKNYSIISLFFCLGILSGLPLAFTAGTLQLWLTSYDMSLKTIGYASFLALPYSLKFLWTPFLEKYYLGRSAYIFWTNTSSIVIAALLWSLTLLTPNQEFALLFAEVFTLAFFSASFDSMLDGLRLNALDKENLGRATSSLILGYRLGMVFSGGIGLILVDYFGFNFLFRLSSLLMIFCPLLTFFLTREKQLAHVKNTKKGGSIVPAWLELFRIPKILTILAVILTYRFTDVALGALSSFYLNKVLGFSLSTIGTGYKLCAPIGTMLGVAVGGFLIDKYGIRSLMSLFCLLQGLANFGYLYLFYSSKTFLDLSVVVSIENFFGGLANAALIVFMSSLTNHLSYKATAYSLFTSAMALPRSISGMIASYLVEHFGWPIFIVLTVFMPVFPIICYELFLADKSSNDLEVSEVASPTPTN